MNMPDEALKRLADLPKPFIPAADDGGLGYTDIEDDPEGFIIVTVGPYFNIRDGDLVEVYFNTTRVAFYSAQVGDTSTLNIRVRNSELKQLGDGKYDVKYFITLFIGGGKLESDPTPVEIKLTVPGGRDPNPDTPELNENLALAFVVPNPVPADAASATVFINIWENMSLEDVPTVSWGGFKIKLPPLPPEEINKQQKVVIDRETLKDVGGGRVPVTYEIRDRVGNRSRWARYTLVDVEFEDPNAPEAPSVVVNGKPVEEIDLAILGADDVIVWVPRYEGIQPGQKVKVESHGLTAGNDPVNHDSDVYVVPSPIPIFLEFKIPNAKVILLGQGSVRVRYVVDERWLSKTLRLPVTGQPLSLKEPEMPDATEEGELDPAWVPNGARFIVPASPAIRKGYRVDIFWDGLTSGGVKVPYTDFDTVTDPTQPLHFNIPHAVIALIAGGTAKAYYIASNGDASLPPSLELDLRIKAAGTELLPIASVDGVVGGKLDADRPSTILRINYPGMARMDPINWEWNAALPTRGIITVSTVGEQTAVIEGTYIAGNRDEDVVVTYSVPGKGSSIPLPFRVEGSALSPGEPVIPKAPGKRLNFHEAMYYDDFLEVQVLPFAGMAPGQNIELEWKGPYFTWRETLPVVAVQTLKFKVPRLEVVDAIGRPVEIIYRVNSVTPSPLYVLNIDSQGMEMPPPRYFPQVGSPTAAVSILSPDQQTGHKGRVRLYGVNPTPWDSTEEHLQAGRVEYFQVPRSIVEENKGNVVLINYSIYRGNNEPFRFSRVLRLQL
ncbi:hypothetical protein KMS_R14760 [Pseudomonas sp. LRP2-20]|uniref:hypothetical protein n=1 Tax=Pseudomonas sp. LRP2-20 TaxID=2944234 RepID=UPI00218C1D25|nr:hypothetical protein [Pseudomonas sp. LRP2-20]BDM21718.1 hypothetical protein KMS_R14760 [Pseudomonas sp. LRP2-20]